MSFLGMDIESVLRHARDLEHNAANELFNVITQMQGIMPQLMEVWHGPDAERFSHQWDLHHRMLLSLHGTLNDVAQSVATAAAAQARTSGH